MIVTAPIGKHFGNLESYPVHNQIHGLVLIEAKSLVKVKNPLSTKWSVDKKLSSQTNEQMCVGIPIYISLVWKLQHKSYHLGQKICLYWIQMRPKYSKTESPELL